MSGLVDSKENQVLDEMLGNATLMPDPVYVGLMTSVPNEDGTGVVEPVGNGYARVSVANNFTQWPAAVGGAKANANDVVFAAATGAWGTITHFGLFDAVSGGNLMAFGALNTPRSVLSTDVFRFLATDLAVTLD